MQCEKHELSQSCQKQGVIALLLYNTLSVRARLQCAQLRAYMFPATIHCGPKENLRLY